MITQKVRSDTGGREGKWVGLIILSILLFAWVSIPFNQTELSTVQILDHQVLISDVKQENLAMIAELRLAHEEIRDLFLESNIADSDIETDKEALALSTTDFNQGNTGKFWPSIELLENDWVAPFVKDQSWKRKGEHEWIGLGKGRYLGIPNKINAASLVLLDSTHTSPQIWLAKTDNASSSDTITIDNYLADRLIKRGWTQVIMNSVNMSQEQDKHQH